MKFNKSLCLLMMSMFLFVPLTFGLPAVPKTILSWDAPTTNVDNTPITDLAGYKVYWSDASGLYTDSQSQDVGNVLTINIQNVIGVLQGAKFFVVTAYDTSMNESNFSNEVSASFFVQLGAPGNLRMQ